MLLGSLIAQQLLTLDHGIGEVPDAVATRPYEEERRYGVD